MVTTEHARGKDSRRRGPLAASKASPSLGAARRRRLLSWFARHQRRFPWRGSRDPWHVFLAEMLLRRTRADQVARQLPLIFDRFPTLEAMAESDWRSVQQALRPLGLRWRAKNIHACARELLQRHGGQVPLDAAALLALPGVGPYVARATVAALAGDQVVLVDANTVRIAGRVAGIDVRGDVRWRRDVRQSVEDLLGGEAKARAWWAVLDLAAEVCVVGTPRCELCPIRQLCVTGNDVLQMKTRRTRMYPRGDRRFPRPP